MACRYPGGKAAKPHQVAHVDPHFVSKDVEWAFLGYTVDKHDFTDVFEGVYGRFC